MTDHSSARKGVLDFYRVLDAALEQNQLARALRLILSNFERFPDTGPLRERVAAALAARGQEREAAEILERVAQHYAYAGFPTRCVAAIEQMKTLHSETTALQELFSTLYSMRSPHLTHKGIPLQMEPPEDALDTSASAPDLVEDELFERALEQAMQRRGLRAKPGALPPIPLLSLLPKKALRRVLDLIEHETYVEHQLVLTPGEVSRDLIWTVNDRLFVERDGDRYRLPAGTLLGLNGFGRPRVTSEFSVSSSPGAQILRLSQEVITLLGEKLTDFPNRLATLRRHALTERLLCSHPLFGKVTQPQRHSIVERFVGLHLKKGEVLIKQEEPSPGLFIILDGQVDIVRKDDDWEITIATLRSGEVFGEIGLVSEEPTVAKVVAVTPGIMLFLERDEFNLVARSHPELAQYAVQLASQRLEDVRSTLSASDLAELE
ncbi:MAG: cyclic nucleotide-binding domain-containing protein [Myxococcota bacterium]